MGLEKLFTQLALEQRNYRDAEWISSNCLQFLQSLFRKRYAEQKACKRPQREKEKEQERKWKRKWKRKQRYLVVSSNYSLRLLNSKGRVSVQGTGCFTFSDSSKTPLQHDLMQVFLEAFFLLILWMLMKECENTSQQWLTKGRLIVFWLLELFLLCHET